MTYRVVLLSRAEADIESNARWWADHHSFDQAVRWFNAVHEQLQTLSLFPESHSLSAENGNFPFEIREKLVGLGSRPSYCAVFTISADSHSGDMLLHVLTPLCHSPDNVPKAHSAMTLLALF